MARTHTKPGPKPGPPRFKRLVTLSETANKNIVKEAERQDVEPASLIAQHMEELYGK